MEKRIFLATPTMHGEEQNYIKEAFDTNWIAPLGKNVDEFEKEGSKVGLEIHVMHEDIFNSMHKI